MTATPVGKIHFYSFTVKESDLDTFQHMNNAVYLRIFEEARWDWINLGGFGLAEIQKRQMGPMLLEVNLRFRGELKARDEVVIESKVVNVRRQLHKCVQEMKFKKNGEVACRGELTFGFVNLQTKELMAPPTEWLKALGWSN